jgi:predicted component of type VI protein secretion system
LEQLVTELATDALESAIHEGLDVLHVPADAQSVLAAAAPVVKNLVSAVTDSAKEAVEPLIVERVRQLCRHNPVEIGTQLQVPPRFSDAAQPVAHDQSGPVTHQVAIDTAPPLHLQLRVEAGRDAGRTFELYPGNLTIGRASGVAIHLNDNTVSHDHAILVVTTDNVTIQDHGSTNGTILNGKEIDQPETLRAGDRLEVGTVVLRVQDAEPEVPQLKVFDQPPV